MTIRFRPCMIFITTILLAAITVTGCSAGSPSDPSIPETEGLDLVFQGGNLHYQNLVLPIKNCIVFNSSDGALSLAAKDGSGSIRLSESAGSGPVFDGEWIYFTRSSAGNALMKIAIDGSNEVRIGRTPLKYLICHQDRLYAIESDKGTVISLRSDGTDRKQMTDLQAVALALSGDRLFISGASDAGGVVMVDLTTGDQTRLLDRRVNSLNISGDWLYFADPNNAFSLTAFSIVSGDESAIGLENLEKPFIVNGNSLYLIDSASQNRLFRFRLDGDGSLEKQTPDLVIDDAVGSFAVCHDYVYYRRPSSNRIYRVSQAGGKPLRIT